MQSRSAASAELPAAMPDRDEIMRALRAIHQPGDVVELRALAFNAPSWKKTVSGYFNDFDKLADAALELNATHNIYVTANPVISPLLARRANRFAPAGSGELTRDDHIARRRWLLVDCDPRRPSGISASDEEHVEALARARWIAEAMAGEPGWPDPIIADSGNGGHLLFACDFPNDEASETAFRQTLENLDDRFGDGLVAIDGTVYNAARIWRCYGTVNRKGDSIPGRPHRLARILSIPEASPC